MKTRKLNSIKWLLVVLFAGYIGGISFFTHTHILNKSIYTHSHPFKKSEKKEHHHTENQLIILEQFYKTSITEDVIPKTECGIYSQSFVKLRVRICNIHHLTTIPNNTQLRAPPVAA
ncbi:MAG: hypothetical protein Q4G63_07610 [Bacteroidia bacterium]|nr:hypothetical protein [Bacteroidia bacterium]